MKRRGMVYVVVMGVCGLAVAIALAGVTISGQRASSIRAVSESAEASVRAQDALMDALRGARNTSAWRTRAAGATLRDVTLNGMRITVSAADPVDGDLIDSLDDSIRLTAVVGNRRIRRVMSLDIEPDVRAMPCLGYSVIVGGSLKLTGSTLTTNRTVHANATVELISSTLSGNVTSGGSITGAGISGSANASAATVVVPKSLDVVHQYTEMVPEVDRSSSDISFTNALVTPAQPQLGGIAGDLAVVNLGGRRLGLSQSRVAGTIVVTRADEVRLESSLLMTPSPGMPALVTRSNVFVNMLGSDFSEVGVSRNLNPSGWPYLGVTDSDTSDWYPSEINGVVYVGGNAEIRGRLIVNGVLVVAGDLVLSGATVTVRWNELKNIPPGFRQQPEFRIVPGSMNRLVDEP